ncbi:MAG: hypothetical protein A3F35_03010 [Candidatus Woykebacteria bacterium RIFCSPHIGHO2_12_FULL_45_10]|uniref:Uncharacterized protein n=1 Tax=Candidatus Woykebacteria bacterium RIFCSPHIGHO2_12_FULL_45_10 TaxID=1802603 RepID=A0A1G1WRP0_9BACT|nr:MAG: hypothetical protein A3F35_03010 [Candidatus Woykebacteria bacterium RIFCSPHIGHO2_12_FULL_45_10]
MVVQMKESSHPVVRILVGAGLAIPAAAGIVWDEVLLAGPIIFLVNFLGFWLGYVVFCLAWAGIGLFVLSVWLRIEPWVKRNIFSKIFGKKEAKPEVERSEPANWRERLVLWIANLTRTLGALAAAVVLGPVYGWTVFKLLGYKERHVYAFTIAAAWIFGGIWVPFYGLGVWGFGLSRVF